MRDDETLWERVLALGTFKSDEGSRVVLEAGEALGRLDEATAQERVDAILELFLRDARYVLWPATAALADVHLTRLAEKLPSVASPAKHLPREIQHDLLLAAHALGPAAPRGGVPPARLESPARARVGFAIEAVDEGPAGAPRRARGRARAPRGAAGDQ